MIATAIVSYVSGLVVGAAAGLVAAGRVRPTLRRSAPPELGPEWDDHADQACRLTQEGGGRP